MNANLLARMQMEHAMRQALGLQRMAVHYQPQVNMATGRITGAEALLRWTDREFGAVSPGVFIPLAEESGYIVTLGAWVMEQAVREAALWMHSGSPIMISVNVSALEFRQPDFVDRITRLLAVHQLPPTLLELELTETILLQDAQEMEQRLRLLADLGIGLAIDDFGTGYSSLAYLKKLPIHKLKIDQSFVRGLPDDEATGPLSAPSSAWAAPCTSKWWLKGWRLKPSRRCCSKCSASTTRAFCARPGCRPTSSVPC